MGAKIEVKNVSKSFEDLLVLDNISFSVFENEFLCICGPTGCGKTTLLNIMAALIPLSKGAAFMNGVPIDPRKQDISFIFQESSCLPWRTVRGNVRLALEVKKKVLGRNLSDEQIERKVDDVIDVVGLRGFEGYYPHQLSGGMKQKVAIAQALAPNPDVLLMDEPFGSLDVQTRYYMENEVLRIWEKHRCTVVFVTHSVEEAIFLGDRILVLTSLPARIKATIHVELERPRERTNREFVELRRQITNLIRWW